MWVVDVRDERTFKKGHPPHAINLMEEGKFETWLGSIIKPRERFYLAGGDKEQVQRMLKRAASIGYEQWVVKGLVVNGGSEKEMILDLKSFEKDLEAYTIVDVRNLSEQQEDKIFEQSLAIPLAELRERAAEIPTDKPIVVHCAGGYRSAAGSSLIHASINGSTPVLDLGDNIMKFIKE